MYAIDNVENLQEETNKEIADIAGITLTAGQQEALDKFFQFFTDPLAPAFVLSGYSGCGKSTLIRVILHRLEAMQKTLKLIDPDAKRLPVLLTATTNKAAENLARIAKTEVRTIHSTLSLRVQTDYKNGTSTFSRPARAELIYNSIIFIDEASFIDKQLLNAIFRYTKDCKIVFIGDPAQLSPVNSSNTPVFEAGFPGYELTEVVRQASGNPIIDLATKLRNTVKTGEWYPHTPDDVAIRHVDRMEFNDLVLQEFNRPDWKYLDSKVLAWTNKTVIAYNHFIQDEVKGTPEFQDGDYAICNSFLALGRHSIKTDQLVELTYIGLPHTNELGCHGREIRVDGIILVFVPSSLDEKKAILAQCKADDNWIAVRTIEETWGDFRAAYAQTINKSQGSTYDRVFIDLDDLKRCTSGDQLARMLYVGISRARHQVILTGDLT